MKPQSKKIWRSELADLLRKSQNAETVEEAALRLVQQKLQIIQNATYPIDLGLVASVVGIDPKFHDEYLPDDKYACIVTRNGRNVILTNKKYPSKKQFSIAHEIAHRMLAGKTLKTQKWRSQQEEYVESQDEEALCELIAAYILGLRPDVLVPMLMDRSMSLELVDEVQKTFKVSVEAAIRACVDYCEAQCAIALVYCVGKPTTFFVERIYPTLSFPYLWHKDAQLPAFTCLKRAVAEGPRIARTQETYTHGNTTYTFYGHARQQIIYRQKRSQPGLLLVLDSISS